MSRQCPTTRYFPHGRGGRRVFEHFSIFEKWKKVANIDREEEEEEEEEESVIPSLILSVCQQHCLKDIRVRLLTSSSN
jgi:DNA-directed RNA polymerase alpha subunit